VSVKNVTLAEEHLHDHFPGFPVMPECLMIEAMAQTGGILVGQASDFQEKVVLAKISKAVFFDYVTPGDSLRLNESDDREAAARPAGSRGPPCRNRADLYIDRTWPRSFPRRLPSRERSRPIRTLRGQREAGGRDEEGVSTHSFAGQPQEPCPRPQAASLSGGVRG
jgi:hypothetical protein